MKPIDSLLKEKIRLEISKSKLENKIKYIRTAIMMVPHIEKIPFDDVVIEFTKRGVIAITMVIDDKHLMITKHIDLDVEFFEDEIIYSFFIARNHISSNVISLSDFAVKFTDYLKL